MKKSTILLVVLVYIVSFLVVGLFGISIKGYNKDIYVDEIKIVVPTQEGIDIQDVTDYTKTKKDYKFIVTYKEDMIVQLKAEVYPTNTTFPNINVVYDEEQTAFAVDIVDQFYLNITFQGAGTVAKFSVESTDGQKYQVPVTVAAF